MGISEIIASRRDAILATAARHGVTHIKVFGSVARGDAREDSDVDFLVEVGPQHSAFFPGGLVADLEAILGHRLSLDAIAKTTLNAPKIADGLQALKWWKEGRLMDIAEYCCFDVKITKEVHEYGKARGEVLYTDRLGQKKSVKVKW